MRWSARSAPRSAACHRLEAARQARPRTSGHAEPAMTCTRLFGAADRATLSTRHWQPVSVEEPEENHMAKGEQRGNQETKDQDHRRGAKPKDRRVAARLRVREEEIRNAR